jgi:hypothetical protein
MYSAGNAVTAFPASRKEDEMPFCPNCKAEYVEGIKTCTDCEVALVAELPKGPEPEYENEGMVGVFGAKDGFEAKIVKGILEEAGIPVWEKAEVVQWQGTFTSGPLAEEVLAVPESRAEEAIEIIRRALESAGETESESQE